METSVYYHIWSLIFKELPFTDLQNCRLVCKQWNSLIRIKGKVLKLLSNEAFEIGYEVANHLPSSTITNFGVAQYHHANGQV